MLGTKIQLIHTRLPLKHRRLAQSWRTYKYSAVTLHKNKIKLSSTVQGLPNRVPFDKLSSN